jgi:hypothetical protein
VFLDTAERAIQRQLRRVEGLNGLNVQVRHTGIKARNGGKAKSEEFLVAPKSDEGGNRG